MPIASRCRSELEGLENPARAARRSPTRNRRASKGSPARFKAASALHWQGCLRTDLGESVEGPQHRCRTASAFVTRLDTGDNARADQQGGWRVDLNGLVGQYGQTLNAIGTLQAHRQSDDLTRVEVELGFCEPTH